MPRFPLPLMAAGLATMAVAQNCQNLTVPVEITAALKATFDFTAPKTNVDVANFILDLTRPSANYTKELLLEENPTTTPGHYDIQATYCEPTSGPGDIAQVLTHGLAFDRNYWDVQPLNNQNYSYVEQALERGYSTFAYDRLGTGEALGGATAQNDPVNDIQAWLEVSVLRALTNLVRTGGLPGIAHKYAKVVHVGHSFGSGLTFGLTAQGGGGGDSISDGIALTGFTKTTTYSLYFLHTAGFVAANTLPAFARFPDGYVVPGTPTGLQLAFFGPGQFDLDMAERAVQLSKPVTVGELLTKGGPGAGNSSFVNPVLIITGDRDIPYCGGNCSAPSALTPPLLSLVNTTAASFLNSSHVETMLIPRAGHGLNFEITAQTTYASILDFFDKYVKGSA